MPRPLIRLALLGLLAWSSEAFAAENPWQIYANSSWEYCHAELLSTAWGIDVDAAKVAIGNKILHDNQQTLFESLTEAEASTGRDCAGPTNPDAAFRAYAESPFGYDDIELLSSAWGLPMGQTKFEVGQRVKSGGSAALSTKLSALRPAATAPVAPSADPMHAYNFSSYGYRDAVYLSLVWGGTVDDAKLRISQKIQAGSVATAALDQKLGDTTTPDFAARVFYAGKYEYCDAEQLANLWGTDTWSAKLAAGEKMLSGMSDELKAARRDAETKRPGHCSAG